MSKTLKRAPIDTDTQQLNSRLADESTATVGYCDNRFTIFDQIGSGRGCGVLLRRSAMTRRRSRRSCTRRGTDAHPLRVARELIAGRLACATRLGVPAFRKQRTASSGYRAVRHRDAVAGCCMKRAHLGSAGRPETDRTMTMDVHLDRINASPGWRRHIAAADGPMRHTRWNFVWGRIVTCMSHPTAAAL